MVRKNIILPICLGLFYLVSVQSTEGQTPTKKALFVIDMQENLLNPSSSMHIDTSGIQTFFKHVNDAIITCKNRGDEVIYIVNEWTNPFENLFTGNVCKKGGHGVGLDHRLLKVNDHIYAKSHPSSLSNKDLLKLIRNSYINEITVVGLMAEGCVKATAKDLKSKKFNVIEVEDALGSQSEVKKNKAIRFLHDNNIKTIQTNEIWPGNR
jgi:nicotinamidase-related amidase